jgi:hypothetical protein
MLRVRGYNQGHVGDNAAGLFVSGSNEIPGTRSADWSIKADSHSGAGHGGQVSVRPQS